MATEIILSKQTMSSLEIAELAVRRHKDVLESIRSMEPAWEKITGRKFRLSEYKDPSGRLLPCYELDYKECMYIASKFNDETRAKLVLRWDDLETGKADPIANQSRPASVTPTKVRAGIEWVKGVSEMLNLNDVSKLSLLEKVATPLGLPLPDYVPSKGVMKSATDLLNEKGYKVSRNQFYKRAIELGYIERISRKSSKGKIKYFNSISKKGLEYGENQINKNNPKETQPEWYVDKFDSLMLVLGFSKMEELNYAG